MYQFMKTRKQHHRTLAAPKTTVVTPKEENPVPAAEVPSEVVSTTVPIAEKPLRRSSRIINCPKVQSFQARKEGM